MKKNKSSSSKPLKQKKNEVVFNQRHWFTIALILVAVFIIYFPSLKKEFINYDDDWYIYNNPFLHPFQFNKIGAIFFSFYSGQYSPLPMIFLGGISAVTGDETFLYNLSAVILHLINVSLVCWL